jgi:hypothetical protein
VGEKLGLSLEERTECERKKRCGKRFEVKDVIGYGKRKNFEVKTSRFVDI